MKYPIIIFIIILLSTLVYASPNDPTSFGNLTATTVKVGGTAGIVNATGDIISYGYIYGQPLLGMMGSGIIQSTSTNFLSEVNITCTGLVCSYNSFKVRLVSGTSDTFAKYCSISAGSTTVTNNEQSVLYIDNNCAIQSSEMSNYFRNILPLGGVWDFANIVAYTGEVEVDNGIGLEQRRMMKQRILNFETLHLHVTQGFNKYTGTFPNFNLTSGRYIYLMDPVSVGAKYTGSTNAVEVIFHNTSTTWITRDQTGVNLTSCDNGTSVVTCNIAGNKYRRYFFFVVGNDDETGNHSQIHQSLALDSTYYSSEANCLDTTNNPLIYNIPAWYVYSAVPLWAYCSKANAAAWSTSGWIDLRSVKTGEAGSTIDTTQFLKVDGSTPLTANWNVGDFNITLQSVNGLWNGSNTLIAQIRAEFMGNDSTNLNNIYAAMSGNDTLKANLSTVNIFTANQFIQANLNVSGRINTTRIDFPQVDVSIVNGTNTWLYLIGANESAGTDADRNLKLYNLLARNVIELSGQAKLIFGYTDTDKYVLYNNTLDRIQFIVDTGSGYYFSGGNVEVQYNITANTLNASQICFSGDCKTSWTPVFANKGTSNYGLIAYLPMNDIGSDYKVKDYSGLGNDFYANNNATSVIGQYGNAISFARQNNTYLNRSYLSDVAWNKNYTFMAWIKYNDTNAQQNIFSCDNGGSNRNGMHFSSGNLAFGFYNNSYVGVVYTSFGSYINQWVHVTGVVSNYVPTLYVNGVSVGTSSSPAYLQSISECRLSSNTNINNVRALNGSMEEVRFFNRSLSSTEVKAYYESEIEVYSGDSVYLKNEISPYMHTHNQITNTTSNVTFNKVNATGGIYSNKTIYDGPRNMCIFSNSTAIVINNNASGITCPT